MLPAGLGIVCGEPEGRCALRLGQAAARVLRLRRHEEGQRHRLLPLHAVAAAAVRPAGVARRCCFEEGLENVFARHHRLAEGTRAAVKAWGLELCARQPKWYSDTVSAIMVPAGINGAEVIDIAYRRYNLALGAGLARMAGRLFRIGHLGDLNECMLLGGIAGAEMAMRDAGMKVTPGSGVGAAEEYWREHGQAARVKRELPPRAPDAQPGGRRRRRPPPAPAR